MNSQEHVHDHFQHLSEMVGRRSDFNMICDRAPKPIHNFLNSSRYLRMSLVSGYPTLLCNGSDPTLKADANVFLLMAVTQILLQLALWCPTWFLPWTSALYNILQQVFWSDKNPSSGKYMLMQLFLHIYTQLFLSFNPDSHTSQADAMYGVQNCIKDLGTWMKVARFLDMGLMATSVWQRILTNWNLTISAIPFA